MASATMNILRKIPFVAFCLLTSLLNAAGAGTKVASSVESFLIDPSKPYVYLEVDHLGPRKPLRDGEPDTGIWLRLKNNCTLPVVVIASGVPTESAGEALWVWVEDEVVPNRPSSGTESMGSGIGYQPGQEDLTDIFLSPNMNEAEVRGAEDAMKRRPESAGRDERVKRPHGYNDGYQPGPQMLKVIPSGGDVRFSVPINHVSMTWHFEIPFRLALPNKSKIRPPYSYVAFYVEDLKDNHRNAALPTPTTH
jgi:hypothetical protein